MTKKRLEQIKAYSERQCQIAKDILEGDRDNYDGADGARRVLDLCCYIEELISNIKID